MDDQKGGMNNFTEVMKARYQVIADYEERVSKPPDCKVWHCPHTAECASDRWTDVTLGWHRGYAVTRWGYFPHEVDGCGHGHCGHAFKAKYGRHCPGSKYKKLPQVNMRGEPTTREPRRPKPTR